MTTANFVIERGIPLPQSSFKRPVDKKNMHGASQKFPWDKMEPGDSFVIECDLARARVCYYSVRQAGFD